MNDYIYQRNGMKKHCFSLFFVMKKNEKQCFINLITRRSSVQIWLPQPGIVIFKITERKRKVRSFGILSMLRTFFVVVSALYETARFLRKTDFDPNLTPKHQKRKLEQDNASCSSSFID